jgi:cephalosporin hydroxylase
VPGPLRSRLADEIAARIRANRTVPAAYRRRLRMPIAKWLTNYYENVLLDGSHWMGVRSLKNPLDAWSYQEIVHDTAPDLLLELGSAYGGSALFFSHLFDLVGGDGRVVTVDHDHSSFTAEHPRITKVTGDTRDPGVIAEVRSLCTGRRVMMIHDASHDAAVVLEDLRNYSDLVAPGCYLIVEDGIGDLVSPAHGGRRTPGPLAATRAFLRENRDFETDMLRERHIATYNPRGYLRRKD